MNLFSLSSAVPRTKPTARRTPSDEEVVAVLSPHASSEFNESQVDSFCFLSMLLIVLMNGENPALILSLLSPFHISSIHSRLKSGT